MGPSSSSFKSEKRSSVVVNDRKRNKENMYSLSPQGPLTAELPKAVRKIGLVAGAFEVECGAEVGQRRFFHLVTVC